MSVQVVLLCEDLQLATFIRRFLKKRGWRAHDIREKIAPPGEGSAEQWVREQYPKELVARRTRQARTTLIVGTDADTLSVAERIATLNQECQRQGVSPRTASEPVIMVVPKRNIETWFAYIRGESPNEADAYPRYPNESDCRNDVRTLDEMCRSGKLRDPAPPSLQAACSEYQKMPARNG
jgi:hypothetical protein